MIEHLIVELPFEQRVDGQTADQEEEQKDEEESLCQQDIGRIQGGHRCHQRQLQGGRAEIGLVGPGWVGGQQVDGLLKPVGQLDEEMLESIAGGGVAGDALIACHHHDHHLGVFLDVELLKEGGNAEGGLIGHGTPDGVQKLIGEARVLGDNVQGGVEEVFEGRRLEDDDVLVG